MELIIGELYEYNYDFIRYIGEIDGEKMFDNGYESFIK